MNRVGIALFFCFFVCLFLVFLVCRAWISKCVCVRSRASVFVCVCMCSDDPAVGYCAGKEKLISPLLKTQSYQTFFVLKPE